MENNKIQEASFIPKSRNVQHLLFFVVLALVIWYVSCLFHRDPVPSEIFKTHHADLTELKDMIIEDHNLCGVSLYEMAGVRRCFSDGQKYWVEEGEQSNSKNGKHVAEPSEKRYRRYCELLKRVSGRWIGKEEAMLHTTSQCTMAQLLEYLNAHPNAALVRILLEGDRGYSGLFFVPAGGIVPNAAVKEDVIPLGDGWYGYHYD